ncbi:GDSL esterase/lipase 6-like [Cryptomeria japonica]|uniref:GDSL esterase/lipase 6-like n=1 Tax=Cryptomeria japonica TaxID=3369 RepID=UPI0025AC6D7E|nr:GDSL esterase/lipase 6-like [Cryptomeria japonica]
MAKSMLIWWMMNSLILQVAEGGRSAHVPAMFVFGDSLADAGTNNFLPNCTTRADFSPYGVSFFPNPTGRFTNGLTVFDFIATHLELPFVPPYRELPSYYQQAIFSHGANFASAGSGLLDSTGSEKKIVNFSDQISKFEEFSRRVRKKSHLRNSLYCISIGGNDIHAHYNGPSLNLSDAQFVTLLVGTHGQYIQRLYRAGARKFLILDISALGCTPIARFTYNFQYQGKCAEPGNILAQKYNVALKNLVDHLNGKLHEVNIMLFNSYDYLTNMIRNGKAFGFSETKSACCGSGLFRANVSYGQTSPPDLYCNDPDAYLFWDAVHPTQRAYSIFSKEIWGGNSSVMHPINLFTLVLGRNA